MSGKVIIVDKQAPQRIALRALLEAAYFAVVEHDNGEDAISCALAEPVDVILLSIELNGSCGVAICRQLKSHPQLCQTPVVLMTSEDRPEQRTAGFEAGADDFLSKPVDELALFARMRSLARFRMVAEELKLREATSIELGLPETGLAQDGVSSSKVAIIAQSSAVANDMETTIRSGVGADCVWVKSGIEAMHLLRKDPPDGFLITMDMPAGEDRGALCSALSYHGDTPTPAILVVTKDKDIGAAARCLDQGASDYITFPPDPNELSARLRAQLKKKLHSDQLRKQVQDGLRLSVIDPLTGLYNRRYLDQHLSKLVQASRETKSPLSLLIFDIDKFKSVNDRFGHEIGDLALRVFADRLQQHLRGVDLIARIGGEEFLVALPGVDLAKGCAAAERMRKLAAVSTPGAPRITVSVGVATLRPDDAHPDDLIRRADQALYQAKSGGRNCVVRHEAA